MKKFFIISICICAIMIFGLLAKIKSIDTEIMGLKNKTQVPTNEAPRPKPFTY